METTPTQVISYFNGEKQYLIPLFQRPYTWDKDSWSTLWDDIMVQYESENDSPHFMGAIVSVPAKTVPVGVTKFLVIDGQQRLVTISILLCALRDLLKDDYSEDSQKIQKLYLTNQFADDDNKLKIVPTNLDRELYSRIVLKQDISQDSSEKLVGAYNFFYKQLSNQIQDEEDDSVSLPKILKVLEKKLQVVMINLNENDDPYLIFESLNFKGQPLTQADLVRNYVLMKFSHSVTPGSEQEKVYHNYWLPMEKSLDESSRDNLTDFLWYYSRKSGKNILQKGLYADIKGGIEKLSHDQLLDEIKRINQFSNHYLKILKPNHEDESGQYLLRLNELKVTTSYPLLLQLFQKLHEEKLSAPVFLTCLNLIESFIIRRLVCGIPTNALNKLFLLWASKCPDANFDNWLLTIMSEGERSKVFPTDEDFKKALIEKPVYKTKVCNHVLWALESSFGHKEQVTPNDNITIEHIMPQTLNEDWKEHLASDWEATHKNYVDTIGNLTLTAYNSSMSNALFSEKKRTYLQSHFELSKMLAEVTKWGKDEIISRSRVLAEQAIRLWPGPGPK